MYILLYLRNFLLYRYIINILSSKYFQNKPTKYKTKQNKKYLLNGNDILYNWKKGKITLSVFFFFFFGKYLIVCIHRDSNDGIVWVIFDRMHAGGNLIRNIRWAE